MKPKKFEEILLSDLQEIKKDLKEVRQTDIPNLKVDMAVVKKEASATAKIITGVGGAITIAVTTLIAWLK